MKHLFYWVLRKEQNKNMQYFGGKSKIAKYIVSYLESIRKPNQKYIEPFVGSAVVVSQMTGEREAYDKHHYLIEMYKALQNGWIPPKYLSKDEYIYIKEHKDEIPHITGFVGFGCSFSGKWFGGYAKNARGDNYCLNTHNSLLKQLPKLIDVKFTESDYKDLLFQDCLIYCDPPYKGTTQYGLVGEFNSEKFWDIMREWSKNNTVIISEYNAPEDFKCVWQMVTKTEIRNKNNERENRIEKLFTY